jgi:hypothetical protein
MLTQIAILAIEVGHLVHRLVWLRQLSGPFRLSRSDAQLLQTSRKAKGGQQNPSVAFYQFCDEAHAASDITEQLRLEGNQDAC